VGQRGKKCPICAVPALLAQVQAERDAGGSYAQIASLTGVNKFSISRHFRHLAATQPVAEVSNLSELELSDQRLTQLAEQLSSQYAAAIATADNRTALDIMKVSARIETERHRRLTKKTAATNASSGKPTVEDWDAALRAARVLRQQKIDRGFLLCPLCGSNLILPQQVREAWSALEAAKALPDVHIYSPDKPEAEVHDASDVVTF
jgi:hypothetical protein